MGNELGMLSLAWNLNFLSSPQVALYINYPRMPKWWMRLPPPQIIKTWLIASTHQHQKNNLVSVKGDIGDDREYRLNLTESIRTGMISMLNLLMISTLELADSDARNRYFGIVLQFQFYQRDRCIMTFRHNLPQRPANWGMQCFDRIDDERFRFYIDDIELSIRESRINAFGEHIDSRDLI